MDTNLSQVVLVKDINPIFRISYGASYVYGSYPRYLTEINDRLYFTADDGENGRELWVSDGTAAGTQLVVDLLPGSNNFGNSSSYPSDFTEFNDKLYFAANFDVKAGKNGKELWVSDGTAEGTQLLIDIYLNENYSVGSNPSYLTEFNDKLYFSARDSEHSRELWVSDGTAKGTQLLLDINPGGDDVMYGYGESNNIYGSKPTGFMEFNDKLYFAANDGENGRELWVTDGTAKGTQLLADINPGGNGYDANSSFARDFTEFNDKLYFSADDGENGDELWVTDGTAEGTQLLVDIYPGTKKYDPNPYFGYGESFSYPAESNPNHLTEFNNKLYFTADDGENGSELWVTDGTAEGTQLLADIYPGLNNSFPSDLTEFNNKLYFSADDGTRPKLWVTDGTSEGTQLVTTNSDGSLGNGFISNPNDLAVVGDELFFSASNAETGYELFKLTVDGEEENAPSPDVEGNVLYQGSDNDVINGDDGDNVLLGIGGNDKLIGARGDDTLLGGNGNDTLDGNYGQDILIGGEDADIFTIGVGQGEDIIADFELASDRFGLVEGLEYKDLTFSDQTIYAGEELIATIRSIDTGHLTIDDFKVI
jgi:ELWxxDGT repeat protein